MWFLSKRIRPGIQPIVGWLCARIRELDWDDAKRLICMIWYVNGTKYIIPLALELEGGIDIVKWWARAS